MSKAARNTKPQDQTSGKDDKGDKAKEGTGSGNKSGGSGKKGDDK